MVYSLKLRCLVVAVENYLGWFSAACATDSREQVHYSPWQSGMKQQSPDVCKTQFLKLHFYNSTLQTLIHVSPPGSLQHKVWHCATFGVQQERGSGRHSCQELTCLLRGSLLSCDPLFHSHRRHLLQRAIKGNDWIRDLKTLKVFSYHQVGAKNQFFICIFRGSTCFLVSLVFAGTTQASLASSIEGYTFKTDDLPLATQSSALFWNFSNQWNRGKKCIWNHTELSNREVLWVFIGKYWSFWREIDFYVILLCLLLISFCSSENSTKFKYTMNTAFQKVCLHTVTNVRVFSGAINDIFFA